MSIVEQTFGNLAKRFYATLDAISHTEPYKKRQVRICDLNTEELKTYLETLIRAEYYNEGVEELESLMIWIKTVLQKRRKVAVEQTATQ